MNYRKTKIFLGVIWILLIVALAYKYRPANYTAQSQSGKLIHCTRSTITVPEVRHNPKSNRIKVKYIKLKSFCAKPKAPIFFLAGGPGQGATWQADHSRMLDYWSEFLETRDVVLIDQRGIGKLNLWWVQLGWPPNDIFMNAEAAISHFMHMGHKAGKAFINKKIDLNGYNSIENAHDIDTVREKLGYKTIVPFGFSYGTHLAQAYIKYHEDRVEKTVLMGVEGLDDTFKLPSDLDNQFSKIADIVESDSTMNVLIPDFVELYNQASEKLQSHPIEIEITTPIKLKRKILIGKFGLDYILKRDMGDANDLPYFPRLLYNIVHGDGSALQWYVEKRFKEFLAIPGMMVSMDMASGVSAARKASIIAEQDESMFGKAANMPFLDMHGQWPVQDLGDEYRTPVNSDVPALLLSGSLDINTPSYQAEKVLEGFRNGTHLVVENAGHEQIQFHGKTMKATLDFLEDIEVANRVIAYPPIQFKSLN